MLALHIGLPRTGTTYLQHKIFGSAPGLTLVHRKRGPEGSYELCRDLYNLAHVETEEFPVYRRRVTRKLRALKEARSDADAALPVVVANENVSLQAGGFWRGEGTAAGRLALRLADLASRLGDDFGPTRVIIGIRRQDQWLASRYSQSSKKLPDFGQADFERRMAEIADGAPLNGPLSWLDYAAVRDAFAAALGVENIMMLPLERMAAAEAETLDALGRFLGGVRFETGGREKSDPAEAYVGTRRNQRSEGENAWKMKTEGETLHLPAALAAEVLARFASSNAALGERVALGFED